MERIRNRFHVGVEPLLNIRAGGLLWSWSACTRVRNANPPEQRDPGHACCVVVLSTVVASFLSVSARLWRSPPLHPCAK